MVSTYMSFTVAEKSDTSFVTSGVILEAYQELDDCFPKARGLIDAVALAIHAAVPGVALLGALKRAVAICQDRQLTKDDWAELYSADPEDNSPDRPEVVPGPAVE